MNTKSIYIDGRGEIICFYLNKTEYTLLITKKGFARGGCIHNVMEYGVVLEGAVEYHIKPLEKGMRMGTWILEKGDRIRVPVEHPHYFIALEDAIFLEWGAPPDQKERKDPKLRAVVDEINRRKAKNEIDYCLRLNI